MSENVAQGGREIVFTRWPAITSVSYAGFWIRVVALTIDALLILGVSFFVARYVGLPLGIATYLASVFLYFPLMESSRSQATIGKGIWALAVTDTRGQRISIPEPMAVASSIS